MVALASRASGALRTLAATLLLGQIVGGVAHAEPAAAVAQAPAAAPASATLVGKSTQDLINDAVAAGEITREQRLVYLAYALHEPASLPGRFWGTAGWDGTHAMAELRAAAGSTSSTWRPSAGVSAQSRNEIRRVSQQTSGGVCDKPDPPNERITDHFIIRYADIGGGLTIQDYVDVLETSYRVQNQTFKWAVPPLGSANKTGKIPVLLSPDVGAGTYGYVTYGSNAPLTGVVGDNPNTPATETAAIATCTALNSDFGRFANPSIGATAMTALKATVAHEYWHIISFGYGDPSPDESTAWSESIPPYIEFETFPDIPDSYSYLWPRFTASLADYPIGQNPGPSQYSNWLLYRYAAERNGGMGTGGGGSAIVTAWMENVAAGQRAIQAYDNALKTKNTTLAEVFHAYANAIRFPKACPDAAPYCFQDAAKITQFGKLAQADMAPGNQASVADVGGSASGRVKNNFAINWVGLPTTGSYTVSLTNTGDSGTLRASVIADLGTTVQVNQFPNTLEAKASSTLDYTVPAGATAVSLTITNEQMTAEPEAVAATTYEVRLQARSGAAAPAQAPSSGFRSYVGHLAKNARGVPGAAATANSRTTLILLNPGSTAASATVTFYKSDGSKGLASAPTYQIAAGTETAIDLQSLPLLVDGTYSAVVEANQELEVVALTGATKRVVGNLEEAILPGLGDADASKKAYVPGIYRRYFGYTTSVTVQNTSPAAANATVSFYDPAGNRVDAATKHIASGASQSIDVEFSNLPVGFRGSAVISADQNVAVTYGTFDEYGTVAVAAAPLAGGTAAYVPAAYSRYYGYDASLVLQSTGTTGPAFTIAYSNGKSQSLTIPAGGSAELYLPGQGLPDGFAGSATIRSTNGAEFIARVNVGSRATGSLNVYDAPTSGATTVALPNVEKNHGPQQFVSSIAIQNVGTAATDVSIRFDDGTTYQVGTFQPGQGYLVYVPNISGLANGYQGGATITTTGQPVVAIVSTNGTVAVIPGSTEGH